MSRRKEVIVMPAHPFMPMSERYLKKLLHASWEIEREADDELGQEENLKPLGAVKRTPPVLKDNSEHSVCE